MLPLKYQGYSLHSVLLKQNEIPRAIAVLEKMRNSHKSKCGDVIFILGALSHMLGYIYLCTQDYERALINFRSALKIRQSILDKDHEDILVRVQSISFVQN